MTRQTKNPWFASRRPWFLTRLVTLFYQVLGEYHRIYQRSFTAHEVSFSAIETLVGSDSRHGLLWRLKDLSHDLWRNAAGSDPEGRLFDWLLGAVFHEAMKLKENLYLHENYQPPPENPGRISPARRFCIAEGQRLAAHSVNTISRQMDSLGFLLGQANYLLRCMLPAQTGNGLLLRLLAEEDPLAEELWGEPVAALFADMFNGCPEKGYLAAATHFAAGHWFDRAAAACRKALILRPDSSEARQLAARFSSLAVAMPPCDPQPHAR